MKKIDKFLCLAMITLIILQIMAIFSKNRTNNEQTTMVKNYQLEGKNAKNTEKSEKEAMLRFCSLSVVNCEAEN